MAEGLTLAPNTKHWIRPNSTKPGSKQELGAGIPEVASHSHTRDIDKKTLL